MFFTVFVGNDVGLHLWQEAMSQHARWLGLPADIESLRLSDSRNISFGWLDCRFANENRRVKQTEDYLITMSSGEVATGSPIAPDNTSRRVVGNGGSNVIRVEVSLKSGEISFISPP